MNTLQKEINIAMKEVHNSHVRIENLKNSSQAFWFEYGESVSLTKTINDKLFLAISNLCFSNLPRGMQVDFSKSFSNDQVLDFVDVFPIRIASAGSRVYLAQEPDLKMQVPLGLFVFLFYYYYNVLNTMTFQALILVVRLMFYILDFEIYDTSLTLLLFLNTITCCVKRLNRSNTHY